jgi:NADH-ubiquinone oxidoreductase MWFE subunit
MPGQSVPPLVIITAMMSVAGLGLSGLYKLKTGETRRTGRDFWDHSVSRRDQRIQKELDDAKAKREQEAKAIKAAA